jgi:hypothetical protein
VEYEAFGDQIKVPAAADAGEHELTASFYVDGQVAVQKQNGETNEYTYDPAGRTEQTVSKGTTSATVIDHYPGPGEAVSWASEEEGKKWTRNIPGIDGTLSAVEKSGEAAVLQLHDLGGDVVATAAKSETETKLLSTYNSTEFGVQVNGTPPTKYSWLGASGLATESASAATASGGASYVPQLGRPLQTQPIGSPGAYANGSYDGEPYTTYVSAEAITLGSDLAAGAPGREATRQAEAKKAQEEAEARARADHPPEAIPTPTEGGAEPLGGSEGWACQYAAATDQPGEGCEPIVEDLGSTGSGATTASVKSAFSEGLNWIKHNATKILAATVPAVATAFIAGVTFVASTGCTAAAAITGTPEAWFACYEITFRGAILTIAAGGITLKVWDST